MSDNGYTVDNNSDHALMKTAINFPNIYFINVALKLKVHL